MDQRKIYGCKNDHENSATKKLSKHVPSKNLHCLQYLHLKTKKIRPMSAELKIAIKSFVNLKENTQCR